MSRKGKRDTRTREQKVQAIVQKVADRMPEGVTAQGNSSAQRVLASLAGIPQSELNDLMPDAVAESGRMFPGKRLLINLGRNPSYKVSRKSRTTDVRKTAVRVAQSATKLVRASNEFDLDLAGTNQTALRSEVAAIAALAEGLSARLTEFSNSEECQMLGEVSLF